MEFINSKNPSKCKLEKNNYDIMLPKLHKEFL